MANYTHTVTLTAKDGFTTVFKTAGAAARQMGADIAAAAGQATSSLNNVDAAATKATAALATEATTATKASTAMNATAGAATKTSASLKGLASSATDASGKMVAFGAAAGGAVAGLAKFGQMAIAQQQALTGLTRSYGDATPEILAFANAMQKTTTFSNDDVIAAAQIASTLQRNYGLTTDEVEQLIKASADLAAVNGTTLEDAVMRTSSAIRGETESSEALGLTLNQQSIDRDNLTQTMTNQEAAHFRLNALLEQSAYAEGAASDQASTLSGRMQQGTNDAQDFAQGIAKIAGPAAQILAPLGGIAQLIPVIGAGAGKAIPGIARMTAAFQASETAMAAFGVATGPVGLGLAALAITVGVVAKAHADAEARVEAYTKSIKDLGAAINDLPDEKAKAAGANLAIGGDVDQSNLKETDLTRFEQAYLDLADARAKAAEAAYRYDDASGKTIAADTARTDVLQNYALTQEEATRINEANTASLKESGDQAARTVDDLNDLQKAHLDGYIDGEKYTQMSEDLAKALEYQGPGWQGVHTAALKSVEDFIAASKANEGYVETGNKVLDYLHRLAEDAKPAGIQFKALADATAESAKQHDHFLEGVAGSRQLETETRLIEAETAANVKSALAWSMNFDARQKYMTDQNLQTAQTVEQARVQAQNDFPEWEQQHNDDRAAEEQRQQDLITQAAIDGAEDRKKAEDEAKQWWAEQQLEHTQAIVDGIHTEQSAREDLAQKLVDIEQDKNDQIESLNEQLASDLDSIAQERASVEQDLADKIADINKQEADVQKSTAHDMVGIEKDRVAAIKDAEQNLAATTKDLQHQRLEAERDLASQLKDLDEQRVEVAQQTQEKLADLAQQRADIEEQASEAIAQAQQDYADSVADTADQIKAVQDQLRETTKAAAEEWRKQVEENRKAIAEIKSDLTDTLGDNKEDYRRDNEDRAIERQRLKEDLANTLADPDISNKDKDAAILEYQRRMQDLEREQQRADADYAEQQKEARQQAAEQERQIRQEQREARKQAAAEEKAARKAAQEQIEAIQKAEMDALEKLNAAKEKAHDQEAEQLADLADQQKSILDDQAKQFAEIDKQKADAAKETAREISQIQKEQAQAQQQYERDVATAQRDADRARKDALREQADQLKNLEEGREDAVKTANARILGLDKKTAEAREKYAEGVQTAQEDAGQAGEDAVEAYAKAVEDLPDEVETLLTVDAGEAQDDLDDVVATMTKVGKGVRGVATLTVNTSDVEQAINKYSEKHVATAYVDLAVKDDALAASASLARTIATKLDLRDPETNRIDPSLVDVYKTPRATNPNLGTTAVDRAMAMGGVTGGDPWGSGTTTLTAAGAGAVNSGEVAASGPVYHFHQPVYFQVATPNLNKELARQLQARGLG